MKNSMILKSANFGNNAGKIRDISFFIPAQCKNLWIIVMEATRFLKSNTICVCYKISLQSVELTEEMIKDYLEQHIELKGDDDLRTET